MLSKLPSLPCPSRLALIFLKWAPSNICLTSIPSPGWCLMSVRLWLGWGRCGEEEEEEKYREERWSTMFELQCVSFGPRNGPLPVVLKHSHPLPPSYLVQMSKKVKSLPEEKGEPKVDASPQSSLAPTCPPTDSCKKKKKKSHTKINSQQCYEIISSPFLEQS